MFTRAFDYVGIIGWEKLIGFGCDGTSINIGAGDLKGFLEKSAPWVVVFGCLAHRLELSLKDALKDTFFSSIDEMLLRCITYMKNPLRSVGNLTKW